MGDLRELFKDRPKEELLMPLTKVERANPLDLVGDEKKGAHALGLIGLVHVFNQLSSRQALAFVFAALDTCMTLLNPVDRAKVVRFIKDHYQD